MLQAQTRACIRRNAALRLYSTATSTTAESSSSSSNENSQSLSNHSIIIRPNALSSIADVYAILRSVEAKYGKIQEFRAMRDVWMPTTYQHRIFAVFEKKSSVEGIPGTGMEMVVDAPPLQSDMPGGPGLDDFKHLLTPTPPPPTLPFKLPSSETAKEASSSWENVLEKSNASSQVDTKSNQGGHKRKITCTITRSASEFHTRGKLSTKNHLTPGKEDNFGRKFLAFSGFAPLKPITPEQKKQLREGNDDTFWMRRATSKWAARTGLLDPGMKTPPPPSEAGSEENIERTKGGQQPSKTMPAAKIESRTTVLNPPTSPPTPTIALNHRPGPSAKESATQASTTSPTTKSANQPKPQIKTGGAAAKSQPSQSEKEKQEEETKAAGEEGHADEERATGRLKKMLGGWF